MVNTRLLQKELLEYLLEKTLDKLNKTAYMKWKRVHKEAHLQWHRCLLEKYDNLNKSFHGTFNEGCPRHRPDLTLMYMRSPRRMYTKKISDQSPGGSNLKGAFVHPVRFKPDISWRKVLDGAFNNIYLMKYHSSVEKWSSSKRYPP